MWIYSKPKNEHESRFLLNLDQCSRINISQIGERWLIEAMLESESIPIASAGTSDEASEMMTLLYESLESGRVALDLEHPERKSTRQTA